MKTLNQARRQDIIFCILVLLYPIVQFAVFYIYVNISSIALAFQKYDHGNLIFAGFENFAKVFNDFTNKAELAYSLPNSLISYFSGLLIATPLAIIFSFFIYKKCAGYKFFRIILFMPSIISTLILVLIYKYLVVEVIGTLIPMHNPITGELTNLLDNSSTAFGTILVFTLLMGFGASTLMYSSTMGGINESIVESAQLDGISFMGELWHITIPMIYPTITTFIVAGIAGIFTNQMEIFSFKDAFADAKLYTFGYYIYRNTQISKTGDVYPELSALGLILSAVAIPLTLFIKKGMEKFGPSVE